MKRLYKEWVTSIFGTILIGLASWDLYQTREFGYNIGIISIGIVLLYFKDSWAKEFKDFLFGFIKKS